MPELPEVETVCRGMAPRLEGRRIVRAVQRRSNLRFPFPERFAERLIGLKIGAVKRRAKYILTHLEADDERTADGNLVWLTHLGMSGSLSFLESPTPDPGPHDHFEIETDDGWTLVYNDPRRFGAMDLFHEVDLESHPMLTHLGPEPLGNEFNAEILSERLTGRRTSIKAALLDQTIVAGLGNIYVCEALFRAGIDPTRSADTIAGDAATRLVPMIRDVLTEAIAAGGSTLRDFVQTSGELGYFQHSFKVYGRDGETCPGCDCDFDQTGGIARIVQSGRSTFYCPRKQR